MKINVTTSGLRNLEIRYERRKKDLGWVPRQVMRDMADDVENELKRQIEKFTPGPVQDLSPRYKRQKEQKYGSAYPILKATGKLMNSIRSRVYERATNWLISVYFKGENKNISNERLAEIHIEGEGKNPQRDFYKLSPTFIKKWRTKIFSTLRRT